MKNLNAVFDLLLFPFLFLRDFSLSRILSERDRMKKYLFLPILLLLIVSSGLLKAGQPVEYKLKTGGATVNENDGTATLTIRVDPRINDNSENITVDYKTVPDTAHAGSDYVSKIGTVTLQKHLQTIDISIDIQNDSLPESQEEFNVIINNAQLHNPKETGSTVTIDTDTGDVVINDDDSTGTTPTISVTDQTVNEDAGSMTFTVTRSITATEPVTFNYATDDITATQGKDYALTAGTDTISAGSSSTTIPVPIINDLMAGEGSETFTFFISNPSTGTELGNSIAIGTIVDNDTALSLEINDASIAEGDSNITAIVKVKFSEALPHDLNITYETRDGTSTTIDNAEGGSDYIAIPGITVTAPAGSTEFDLNVTIIGDTIGEPVEEFYIVITDAVTPGGIVRADDTSIITIFDNDNTDGCSRHTGLITINEYQNNPNYKDPSHPLASNSGKVPGNFVEIKYIDFLIKQYVNDLWKVSIYTSAGTGSMSWNEKDIKCTDPRYDIFEFPNNLMGKEGYVVLTDDNGNEVDILNINNTTLYDPGCNHFPYDTDYPSSAQNKDLFRDPDGTGDWYDHGSGANSGGSRCVNDPSGLNENINTYFEAIDVLNETGDGPQELPDIYSGSPLDTPIRTKVVNKPFNLRILWLDVDAVPVSLKNSGTIDINVYLGYEDGLTKLPDPNPKIPVLFNNGGEVQASGFTYHKAVKGASAVFECCLNLNNNYILHALNECETNSSLALQVCGSSRNKFAIRPDKFDVNISDGAVFIAEKDVSLSFQALDGNTTLPKPSPDYIETEGSSFEVDLNVSGDCAISNLTITPSVDFGFGPRDGEHNDSFTFNDVGDVNMSIYEININETITDQSLRKEFAKIDIDDTPADIRLIGPFKTNIAVIPNHFEVNTTLSNHNTVNNFTYISADLNMSSTLDINITAMGFDGNTTRNYTVDCYAHPIDLDIGLSYSNLLNTLDNVLYLLKDDNAYSSNDAVPKTNNNISISNITEGIFSDSLDHNGTAVLTMNLNFDRKMNEPANPFEMDVTDINVTDDNDTSNIVYDEQPGINAPEDNATYFYGRAKPAQTYYETADNNIDTPVSVVIYCDLGYIECQNRSIMAYVAQTNDDYWWKSWYHDASNNDGNITLKSTLEGVTPVNAVNPTSVLIGSEGENKNINVSRPSAPPVIVHVDLVVNDPTSPPPPADYTNEWVIYNPESATIIPSPFYRVKFLGASGWAGHGDTGHVVGGQSSAKPNKRLEW